MGICKDCRHWSEHNEETFVAPWLRSGWGECMKAGSEGEKPVDPTTLAFASDHEEYEGNLFTRPNFGCVMFEPK